MSAAQAPDAVSWAARAIVGGARAPHYYASSTNGPGFACAANDKQPCAWGAVKEVSALARVPVEERSADVRAALELGAEFLLSRDPAVADYPMGYGNTRPSGSWFKLGFPSGYVTSVLEVLEALAELGLIGDPRLEHALQWLADQQGPDGRWLNRYAYTGKTWGEIERQGRPSKWVTLRACTVLRAAG